MYEVNAIARESRITKASRNALRKSGKIPATLYDKSGQATSVGIDAKEVETLLKKRGASGLVKLNVKNGEETESHQAIFKNIQYDWTQNNVLHLDFQKAYDDRPVKIKVPIKGTGTPYGVLRQGGVLQQNSLETEILTLPKDIPDVISIDVSHLKLNEIVRARDVEGFTFSLPLQSFFTVASSRAARKIAASAK